MRVELYGLVVDVEMDLHQDRHLPDGTPADVAIRQGAPIETQVGFLAGTEILRCEVDGRRLYSFVRSEAGWTTLRFFGACDFVVSPALDEMTVHPVSGVPAGLSEVLTTGAALAFHVYQRGHLVLHASAVERNGHVWGLVGRSGMGKSTLAALLCAAGAGLVTDDVLRVDDVMTRPVSRLGATELRLRKGADVLVDHFSGRPEQRRSADDRQVLRLPGSSEDRAPLRALVVPLPDRDSRRVVLERLGTRDALFALLGFPRLVGWQDRAVLSRQLELTAALVQRVPVVTARVPWGPPFRADLAEELETGIADEVDVRS